MARFETEFLDADLAARLLVVAQDDGEGNAGGLGGFELCGEFRFEFVGEFGLVKRG